MKTEEVLIVELLEASKDRMKKKKLLVSIAAFLFSGVVILVLIHHFQPYKRFGIDSGPAHVLIISFSFLGLIVNSILAYFNDANRGKSTQENLDCKKNLNSEKITFLINEIEEKRGEILKLQREISFLEDEAWVK